MHLPNFDVLLTVLARPTGNDLENELHVWSVDLDGMKLSIRDAEQMLPESEKFRSDGFCLETIRTLYIKCHYLLRLLLGQYLGKGFYHQEFHYNEHGKPSLKNDSQNNACYFNLSNTGSICVYVFTKACDPGVDVEKIETIDNMNNIVERFFSSSEKIKYFALPEQNRKKIFFQYWVRKEALLKAIGTGLSYPLDKFDVISDETRNAPFYITTNHQNSETEWMIQDINIMDGYAAALALRSHYPDHPSRLRYFRLT